MTETIIVSRHSGAIRWLESKDFSGKIISHMTDDFDVKGKIIIGTLPVLMIEKIIEKGGEFILLSLPSIAFGDRGNELSPKEMDDAGATLHRVMSIKTENIDNNQ